MKPKSATHKIWVARDEDSCNHHACTRFYFSDPTWDEVNQWWMGKTANRFGDLAGHNPHRNHYGLRPGKKKQIFLDVTIREGKACIE